MQLENLIGKITCGNARELAELIADESIDLVFTDPVYEIVEDYEWLAATANRVLKNDKACLAWVSKRNQAECQITMQKHLDFVYSLDYVVQAKPNRLVAYHLFIWNTPCLWMQKGKNHLETWIPDVYISAQPKQNGFKWQKNIEVLKKWLCAFTKPGDLVLDCFAGSGSLGVACKQTGRRYIGFEIVPERALEANERVENAQMPLFIPDDAKEQFQMFAV